MPSHTKYPIAPVAKLKPGRHDHDYEGGVDLGNTPPPDGEYLVVGEAKDAIGNHAVITKPADHCRRRRAAGADHRLPASRRSPSPSTALLRIEVTVEQRRHGRHPQPGAVLRHGLHHRGELQHARAYPRTQASSASEPTSRATRRTRLSLPLGLHRRPLAARPAPDHCRLHQGHRPRPRRQSLYFWIGLQHEQVRIVNDKVKPIRITIGF